MSDKNTLQIHVSYNRNKEASIAVVDKLEQACQDRSLVFKRVTTDNEQPASPRNLDPYEAIIVVLDQDYLMSEACMSELLAIAATSDFPARVYPLVLHGTTIDNPEDRIPFYNYWKERTKRLEKGLKSGDPSHLPRSLASLGRYKAILSSIDGLMANLGNRSTLPPHVHPQTDFAEWLSNNVEATATRSLLKEPENPQTTHSEGDDPKPATTVTSTRDTAPTQSSDTNYHCDTLILYVNDIERSGLVSAFNLLYDKWPREAEHGTLSYYDLGDLGGQRVFAMATRMGSVTPGGSATMVMEAIHTFKPKSIIAVGVAFGMDSSQQAIGHILVSEKLTLYEPQKRKRDEGDRRLCLMRGDTASVPQTLYERFQQAAARHVWNGATVEFGQILSGEKLVDDPDFKAVLLEQFPEAIGGEMEAAGIYSASWLKGVNWILVKGVCDYADGSKSVDKEERQAKAAQQAARFVLHTLTYRADQSALPPSPPQPSQPSRPSRPTRLHVRVKEEIRTILTRLNENHPFVTELKEGLDAWYRNNKDETRILPSNANDAERLMHPPLFDQIQLIHTACKGYFDRVEKDVEARDRGWRAARDLVGWLVLLVVRDDWSREAIGTHGSPGHFILKLPLVEHHAQGVALASVGKIKAVLKTRATREQPGGAFDLGSLEIGWDKNDVANFVKQSILRQIAPDHTVPEQFKKTHNDYLDTRLQIWIARGIACYLPIDLDGGGDALADSEVKAILRTDIPHLNILEISRGDSLEVLILSEAKLSAIIDDFLDCERHLAA